MLRRTARVALASAGVALPLVLAACEWPLDHWAFELHDGATAVPVDGVVVLRLLNVGGSRGWPAFWDQIAYTDTTTGEAVPFRVDVLDDDDPPRFAVVPLAPLPAGHAFTVRGVDTPTEGAWHATHDAVFDAGPFGHAPACVGFTTGSAPRVLGLTGDVLGDGAALLVFSEPMRVDEAGLITWRDASGDPAPLDVADVEVLPDRPWVWRLHAEHDVRDVVVPAALHAVAGGATAEVVTLVGPVDPWADTLLRALGVDPDLWDPDDHDGTPLVAGCAP